MKLSMKLSVIGRNLGRVISVPLRFLSPMTASLFDKRAARYWQGLPLHRMTGVLLLLYVQRIRVSPRSVQLAGLAVMGFARLCCSGFCRAFMVSG